MSHQNWGETSPNPRGSFTAAGAQAFFRRRFPEKTVDSLAAACGAPRETAASWMKGARPSAAHLMALIATFGPAFLEAAFAAPPRWVICAAAAERLRALDGEIAMRRAEAAALESAAAANWDTNYG